MSGAAPDDPAEETRFLGGRLVLLQPRHGHRVGTDAVLVVAAARPYAGGKIADLGAGVGAIGLSLALISPALKGVLIEIDPQLAELAAENARLNGCLERVEALCADIRRIGGDARLIRSWIGACDLVVMNPPFIAARRARASPDPARARAHVMAEGELPLWLAAAAALLKPKGRLVMIDRADGLDTLLASLRPAFGAVALRAVHPYAHSPAPRLLVSARKGGRAPLQLLPPLVLHDAGGAFTPLATALHRGEAELAFQ